MLSNRCAYLIPLLLAILSLGVRQPVFANTLVVPSTSTGTNPIVTQQALFGEGSNDVTFQWVLAGSQLTAMIGDPITGIGFRLGGGTTDIGPTTYSMWDLELSSSLNPVGSLSTNFASNIAPNGVTVLSGPLSLGPVTGGSGPNPFFLIDFTSPFTYTGGDLLMTLNVANASTFNIFDVDANHVGDGVGDTVSQVPFINGGQPLAHFVNYPTTEFQYSGATSAAPEPSTLFLLGGGLLACSRLLKRRVLQ